VSRCLKILETSGENLIRRNQVNFTFPISLRVSSLIFLIVESKNYNAKQLQKALEIEQNLKTIPKQLIISQFYMWPFKKVIQNFV
jgi:hypothetical protein